MAQQRKGKPTVGTTKGGTKGKGKAAKQPTQRTPQQRIMVVGPTGKRRFEWRDWA